MQYKSHIIYVVIIALLVGYVGYVHFFPPKVIGTTQNQLSTPSGLIKVSLQNNFKISEYQAKEFSQQINESLDKPPDKVIPTTGSEWEKMAKKYSNGADIVFVTDPKRPGQKPNPGKDDVVNLNQYNLFAYPKTQAIIGFSPGKEVIASYQWKVLKGKGMAGYLGPYGRLDLEKTERSSFGIMITVSGK